MQLTDDQSDELTQLVFDHLCAQPLRTFVDLEQLLPMLDDALAPERTRESHARWGIPMRDRLLALGKSSELTLSSWLPGATADALDQLLGQPVKIPRKAIDDAVASEQVRESLRQLVTETLDGFVQRGLSGDNASSSSGPSLRGVLAFGARAAAGVGKGLLGGLGDEMQKQLQERAKLFVDASMAAAQKRLADRLASEETSRSLGKQRQKSFRRLLSRTEREAATWIEKSTPWAEMDRLLPDVVAHNLARQPLRDAIMQEARALVETLGDETLGEALTRLGLYVHAQHWVRTLGTLTMRSALRSESIALWLNKVTQDELTGG
ncbi:MAG: hypothetical protein Q8Q09_22070 [Deltaproteobacteria bacterium]|nr:hypothetical protein [Deltaproteobacteria bacterium]